jgi:hypothetical protein
MQRLCCSHIGWRPPHQAPILEGAASQNTKPPHPTHELMYLTLHETEVRQLFHRAVLLLYTNILINFTFWTMNSLKVNEKPTNALIIQCIGTQYSPTCFDTLKFHHQGVKHDPAEVGAQCRGKQRRMGAVCCNRRQDHVWLPDNGILKCRNMYGNIEYQHIEWLMHLLVFHSPPTYSLIYKQQ